MEEDIKVLEETINSIDFNNKNQVFVLGINQIELIKKLINRNRDLEERDRANRKVIREYSDCIPKSKVREKIEIKYRQAKGLYEQGVLPRPQYTMKLLTELKEELLQEGDDK